MSNNLNLDQVAGNQNQKEVTINDQAGQLDAALTEILDVDFSGGNVTLTATQFRRSFEFRCSGLTANRDLTLPASIKRAIFSVVNTDTETVTVKKGSGSVAVAGGTRALLSTDGTANDITQIAGQATTTKNYNAGFFFSDLSVGSALVGMHIIAEPGGVVFPSGLTESRAKAKVASTGTVAFDILKNGSSVGTLTFTASVTGVFTFSSQQTFAQGDTLEFTAPGTPDGTLANVAVTLRGSY